MKAQGTELYTIDPADGSVIVVGCPTSIDGIDTSVDQNETTCLNSLARTYEAGLATPGTATFGIQTNPQDASHVRLHQLKVAGTTLKWAVGWSDGTGTDPTAVTDSDGDYVFELPENRSWVIFDGFMNSYPFSFGLNAQVASTVGIQVSGEPELIPATAS
jgi:hypothetical protein